jgi:AcrR family transcriptional regulator
MLKTDVLIIRMVKVSWIGIEGNSGRRVMARLSRAESQEHNRAKVLAAARDEFAERGFRDAKIDSIAERAGLTRGGVYSNFPGKRALYFAVLADLADRAPEPPDQEPSLTAREALGALARAWVAKLPLADTDEPQGTARLAMDLLPEIQADQLTRRPFAQLMRLDALLLGLALERLRPRPREHPADTPAGRLERLQPAGDASVEGTRLPDGRAERLSVTAAVDRLEQLRPPPPQPGRLVRVAEAALTVLHGATRMAAAAPGFLEPFNVVRACEQLADLELNDSWVVPPFILHAQVVDEPWVPPHMVDAVRKGPARLDADGVVAVLGLHRIEAVEEAVRASPEGVTVALVTGEADELGPLARLAVAEMCAYLRQAFPASAWPRVQVVCDENGVLARAAGVPAVSDGTEVAVRIQGGRIVLRADGRGACHAAASR